MELIEAPPQAAEIPTVVGREHEVTEAPVREVQVIDRRTGMVIGHLKAILHGNEVAYVDDGDHVRQPDVFEEVAGLNGKKTS